MSSFAIVRFPDPILRTPSAKILEIGDDVRILAQDLIETLNANTLLGMAAIMVGIPRCVAVLAVDSVGGFTTPSILLNPVLLSSSQDLERGPEGCPSIPNIFEDVTRPKNIVATYLSLSGDERTVEATGLQARVIQHQIDLCNGILFIDRLSRLKRTRIEKKVIKLERQGQNRRDIGS